MPTPYLLKITLKDTPHIIWRRFVVPSDITLNRLHDVVQIVMGWKNCHFHAFIVGKQQYMPSRTISPAPYNTNNDLPEEKYTLESLVSKKGAKIMYWYDFGDDWMHEIVAENINYTLPDKSSPIYCTEGIRACPPDDCGGVYGFVNFCEAMADPKHPEHRELKSWYGGKFDPDRFDIDAVNKKLGAISTTKKTAKKATKKAAKKT